ncbi:MAG: CopD family protein, partial [Rhodospirillales bacterium]|nr:CopD family protein [Rhodospirillales bacterium]
MLELSGETTLWIKAVHIIAVLSWMAGMLYLPRLFVYHADVAPG